MLNIVIVGPTASGKTAVAAELARRIKGEIISADSRQIYKYLDIGTNKSGKWDTRNNFRVFEGIPQYLTDIIEPDETFSAGDYSSLCRDNMRAFSLRGKVPIIAGGTGLYIKALIDGLAPLPGKDEKIRKTLNKELEKKGIGSLYDKLKKLDPESAKKNRYNPQRLIRSIEVCTLTGKTLDELHKKTLPSKERYAQFGLYWPREKLYSRINSRSEEMIDSGMIKETENVLNMGFKRDCEAFKSIGYRDIIQYLDGKIKKTQLVEMLSRDTRHYAKRQLTWFNRDKRIEWIDMTKYEFSIEKAVSFIFKRVANLI